MGLSTPLAASEGGCLACGTMTCPATTPPGLPAAAEGHRDRLYQNYPLPEGLRLGADWFDFSQSERTRAVGNVVVLRGESALAAEEMRYNHQTEILHVLGPMAFENPELALQGSAADWYMLEDQGSIADVDYGLKAGPGRGTADKIKVYGRDEAANSQQASELQGVTFTSCPAGDEDWLIRAKRLELDHDNGRGKAYNAFLEAGGIPVLYLPYYSFPLDDRRISGFLAPTIGNASDQGLDITVPYYFNLAPNYDLTLYPRLISERGAMLGTEFRYLQPDYRGTVYAEYLPDDDELGTDRWYADISHRQNLQPGWYADIDIQRASDEAYFEDFSDNLNTAATTYLRSNATLNGLGPNWRFALEFDDFQPLDPDLDRSRQPYRRLPRAQFDYFVLDLPVGLNAEVESEAVYFDRDAGPTGARLDLVSRLERPFRGAAWFVRPSMALHHTDYLLDGEEFATEDDTISRTLPVVSIDSGLFFERTLDSGRRQTLEPRLQYLYVPYDDQSRIPDFDTSETDFSYSSLFRENRFTGADRLGDANQFSAALTSRIFEPDTGRQKLSFSIGQIFYLRDRKVTLNDRPPETESVSPIIAEVIWQPNEAWRLINSVAWDANSGRVRSGLSRVQFRQGPAIFNAAYRYRRDRIDQTDVSVAWPVSDRWQLFARWNYALDDNRSLEQLAGFEYRNCCWSVRLLHRKYLQNQEGATRENIFLQFELTGLGRVGGNVQSLLERGILGYRSDEDVY